MSSAITLNPSQLRDMLMGALVAADKTGVTPKIHGVLLEWDSTFLHTASTDRYRLAHGATEATITGKPGRVLMARADMQQLVKLIPAKYSKYDSVVITVKADIVSFQYKAGLAEWVMAYKPEPHDFPEWRKLIPTEDVATERIRFTTQLLADIGKMPRGRSQTVTLHMHGPLKPAEARWEANDVSWTYLLMPVRT